MNFDKKTMQASQTCPPREVPIFQRRDLRLIERWLERGIRLAEENLLDARRRVQLRGQDDEEEAGEELAGARLLQELGGDPVHQGHSFRLARSCLWVITSKISVFIHNLFNIQHKFNMVFIFYCWLHMKSVAIFCLV